MTNERSRTKSPADDAKRRKKIEDDLAWATRLIAAAQVQGFYGKLIVCLDGGDIQRVIKEQVLKKPEQ